MSRMLSLQYLGRSQEYEREEDNAFNTYMEDYEADAFLSSQFGDRAPKGRDFEIQVYFAGRKYYSSKGGKRHSISYHKIADIIFGSDDMLSTIMEGFDLSRLDTINKYRMDPKRSYARIDAAIHRVGKDAVRFIRKFFSQRPNPLRSNAESTIKSKGFDQYGVDTGVMMAHLTYRVKYL